ncbi:MAG: pyridoxamine 5'-phosphate oxidase [Ferruginibacter sp.]
MENISAIRTDYHKQSLDERDACKLPQDQFKKWFDEAVHADVIEVNAMTLATVDSHGFPSARIVLLKGIEEEGLIFYTNYDSKKGIDISENPNVAIVFFWKELERQVRVRGRVEKLNTEESDKYFKSRPFESKIGAMASPQSKIISKQNLETNFQNLKEEFKDHEIVRPNNWGGYVVKPVEWEFWQGRPGRLHDRLRYSFKDSIWLMERLAP